MRLKKIIFILLFILFSATAHSEPVESMTLHGAGEAYYLKFIKVYDAALYTRHPASAEQIQRGEVSKCLLLQYDVSLKQQDFVKAANTVLGRQFATEQLEMVRTELRQLHDSYIDVQDGDQYSLCYDSQEKRTTLSHNNKELVRIYSEKFAEIYFSIWLGENSPLDDTLRDNLLARNEGTGR
ncbi:chalcone isomerase family protein [Desulfopila sp. IMCC35008]|uniref:chalcone isomerase family protein n=1 Tax=Desulfopila sp. IMCC35008 TaxID=2653858 RepID=UPI0013D2A94B|nr:chalcone isomerase family protein [Desulfopila sp. IMCC35008]